MYNLQNRINYLNNVLNNNIANNCYNLLNYLLSNYKNNNSENIQYNLIKVRSAIKQYKAKEISKERLHLFLLHFTNTILLNNSVNK